MVALGKEPKDTLDRLGIGGLAHLQNLVVVDECLFAHGVERCKTLSQMSDAAVEQKKGAIFLVRA